MGVSVKVNRASLSKSVKSIKDRLISVNREIINEVAKTALAIDADAKKLAPVDTGRLRASITPEFSDGGMAATVSTNVKYAPYIEFGTTRRAARPFLFPAAEAHRQTFVENIKKILNGQKPGTHTNQPQVQTGKRGGRYIINSKGKKVYKKRK